MGQDESVYRQIKQGKADTEEKMQGRTSEPCLTFDRKPPAQPEREWRKKGKHPDSGHPSFKVKPPGRGIMRDNLASEVLATEEQPHQRPPKEVNRVSANSGAEGVVHDGCSLHLSGTFTKA